MQVYTAESAIFLASEVPMSLIIGAVVGGAAYALAKKKQASSTTAAVTATAAGIGGAIASSLVIGATTFLLPIAAVGGIGYLLLRRGNRPKALGPGRG